MKRNGFYARVWSDKTRQRGWGRTWYTWYFRVYDPAGRVVAMDNTGDFRKIYDKASELVRVFNECQVRGIDIKQPKWIKEQGL